ncbi:MAG: hypothetical protein GX046_03960 [Tissierellia bacterium]|nr:hypothetical protein [Tissierellia bacterium]
MIFSKKRNREAKNTKDAQFLDRISPKGGIVFKDRYVKKGDGFETCLIVYGFPKRNGAYWMASISDFPDSIVTIDVSSADQKQLLYNLNQALSEHESRYLHDRKITDTKSAQNRYLELTGLYDDIYEGEVVKNVLVRIYLSARTRDELEEKVASTLSDLESGGYKGALHLNLLEDDFKALQRPLSTQREKAIVPLYTKEITSSTLAAGIHTHYTKLHDPEGTYYGQCLFSDGAVLLDPFHSDSSRKFYNSIVLGKMGSGKSTLLKKIALTEIIKGNKVRVFDASGEFFLLAKDFGGAFLSLDGRDNRINPLHIYSTSADKNRTQEENDQISFQNHMSKLDVFFTYLFPELTSSERAELTHFIYNFYIQRGIITEKNVKGACFYEPERYGVLSDFVLFLGAYLASSDITSIKRERAETLQLKIKSLLLNYKTIFDGPSTFDIGSKKVAVFNVKGIANLPKEVFEAILFNVLNILWNEMLENVTYGEGAEEGNQNQKYLLILDESHRLINSSSAQSILTFYENFMREARKYLAGIVLSSHLLDDFGDNVGGTMNRLFQLTQYKFIFKQDISSKKTFEEVFSKELTKSEINLLPTFGVGECLLSISGFANIAFKVSLGYEEEEKYLVTGGI